ncbi:hypothetical protein M501DRAFT_1013421 [Patellaria atrata CBS 101060]|uniref:Bys1 family protein n=1 Tax=Patellaria atrata CBS 101060 TaxID=1346257 RepID=A0A9P4VSH7_9PEZI|nr:hypothetical protein M501DRAFT_1013421 [Patellaria atrata CBS 101060]
MAAPIVNAVGNAVVTNRCPATAYVWSVGSSVSAQHALKTGQSYSEALHWDPKSGGITLKITTSADGLYNGSPQTNFGYTLDGNNVWYDLNDVFGDPFSGKKLVVTPSDGSCGKIVWEQGVRPAGSHTYVCGSAASLTLTLC